MWVLMRVGMVYSIILLATRVIVVMFFTGLVGCGTVVLISWVSIFKDGFSDLTNRKIDEGLDAERIVTRHDLALSAPNTKAS